jgi:hypothetical protein
MRSLAVVAAIAALALPACSGGQERLFSPPSATPVAPSPRASAGGGLERGHIRVAACRACIRSARRAGVDLQAIARSTTRRVQEFFPELRTTARIRIDPAATIPEMGVGGFTDVVTGVVTISLDPGHPDFERTLRTWLPITLAHELDHAERTLSGPGYGNTLLQAMVSEGMADAFAGQVLPASPAIPWDHALSRAEESVVWREARPRLGRRQSSAQHALWFYGTESIPRWAGYTIGHDIVGSFLLRHPEVTAAQMVRMRAGRVLEGSRFSR